MSRRPRRTQRRVGQQERSTVIRIFTEGEITKRQYLNLVGPDSVKLQFGKRSSSPVDLVKRAKRDQQADRGGRAIDRSFDEIWCIFDRDDHHRFDEATQAVARAGIRTAVSNPCLELWLILHVSEQTAHISTSRAQARAAELALIDGKNLARAKSDTLKSSYQQARDRALGLDKMHRRNGSPQGSNPSTGVWRLVDSMTGLPD